MTLLLTALRRSLLLVLLAAGVGATYAWWRDRHEDGLAPAEWPPIVPPEADPPVAATSPPTSSSVDPLADTRSPEARSDGWVEPDDDGSCPLDHPVKANDNSRIFHVPGGRFYDRTKPERCYSDDERAIADGYRRAKN